MSTLRSAITNFDSFSQSNFLTFNGTGSYSTFSGGIIKLIFLGFILAFFITTLTSIFRKQEVNFNQVVEHSTGNITISNQNFMMGGFLATEYDQPVFQPVFRDNNHKYYDLEQCTRQHWKIVRDDIYKNFEEKFKEYKGRVFCLPLNYSFSFGGQFDDAQFIAGRQVYTDLADPRTSLKDTHINLIFTKANISPNEETLYTLSWRTADFRAERYLDLFFQFSAYSIVENSIYPFGSSEVVQTGVLTHPLLIDYFYYPEDEYFIYENQTYMYQGLNYYFNTNELKYIYTRSYPNILSALSAVGGLFWSLIAIIGSITFIYSFSDMAYKVSIGIYLFDTPQKVKKKFESYNVLTHIKHKIYALLSCCCGTFKEKYQKSNAEYFQKVYDQVNQQLCVRRLFTRISYLQKAVYLKNTPYQNVCLFMTQKMKHNEAAKVRRTKQMIIKLSQRQMLLEQKQKQMEIKKIKQDDKQKSQSDKSIILIDKKKFRDQKYDGQKSSIQPQNRIPNKDVSLQVITQTKELEQNSIERKQSKTKRLSQPVYDLEKLALQFFQSRQLMPQIKQQQIEEPKNLSQSRKKVESIARLYEKEQDFEQQKRISLKIIKSRNVVERQADKDQYNIRLVQSMKRRDSLNDIIQQ